ncbi:MAG: biotin/lipoate A/B protein ligase family protein [Bacteroidota bacterium]|nr:biotin/lipoate A/B protein ligase family protein [Bacteroidota bacterium]
MAAKQTWRLLRDKISEPWMHFAIEEAILRLTDEENQMPTLRIRQTEPSVWIGYYQIPEEDVDVDYCQKNNLKIVRRLNSGGAVYQDFGSFCYTAFFNKADFLSSFGLNHTDELYNLFGNVIVNLCNKYNIQAGLSPVNDITVNNKKIYGSAQIDWYSAFAHSGSILVNADLNKMQHALKPSNLKFADKGFKSVRERVVNLSIIADIPAIKQIKNEFISSFAENLNISLVEQELTEKEKKLADQLFKEKYSKPEWTFTVSKPHTTVLSTKIASGVITLKCQVFQNRIQSAGITGDFLMPDHKKMQKIVNELNDKTLTQATKIIEKSKLHDDIINGLVHLIKQINA